jgi:DNA-binding NarL/FixJ family response regulator
MKEIEIFIIDDHPMFIKGIRETFKLKTDHIFIGGIAKTIAEARDKLKHSDADIIFLDLVLPGESGVDYCIELKKVYPEKKVIALTGELDTDKLYAVWNNNADAVISKVSGKKKLIKTINAVLEGQRIIGTDLPPLFDNQYKTRNKPFLTRRESQVITLLVSGKLRKEVADILSISIDTVDKHCSNVYKKFEVDSLPRFIQEARKLKIIS